MTEYNIRLNPNCAAAVHTGLKFKAGDKGITFRIAVDELDTTGTTAKIVFLRANGTSVESDISGTDGVYIYKTLGNEFAVPGKTVADVKFYASGNRESTASFIFEVCGDTMNGLGAGTGGYSDRLEQLVSEAEAAGELTEQAKAELEAAESNMKTTEAEMAAVIQNFKNQYGEVGALNPRGNWNSGATYQIRDLVYYNSISWICLAPNTGIAPTDANTAYWMRSTDLEAILNGTTPVGNALKLNGLTAEEFVSNPNLLINSDFRNPVNSSGLTEWSGTGLVLGVDMWNFEANAASGWTMSLTDSGIQVTFDSDGFATFAGFQQRTAMESGEKYTLSFSVDNKIYTKTITGMADLSGGIRISDAPVYLFYLSSNNTIYIRVYKSLCTDYTATVNWIKLEKGSIATPFIPPNKEVEKLKCGVANEHLVAACPQSDASISDTFTIQDLLNKRTVTFFTNWKDSTNFPFVYANGVVIPGVDTSISTIFYVRANTSATIHKIYTGLAKKVDGVWAVTWSNGADGGNADTVDGYHASDFISTQGGTANGHIKIDRGTAAGSFQSMRTASDGTKTRAQFWDGGKNASIGVYNLEDGSELARFTAKQGAITFHTNGQNYDVHHDGNSAKVVISASAPSDTTALWYDTANKICKRYVDGAWQA